MSDGAKNLLDAFDHLPPAERQEVLRVLLRRTASAEYEAFTDDELVGAADDVFLSLDRKENEG